MKDTYQKAERLAIFLIACGFALAFYRTAWVAEDAFITFRVIENWIAGYGLRWNIDERVQVFTHPLWMLGLSLLVWIGGDPYWAAIGLSAALLIFFVLMAFKAMGGVFTSSLLAVATLLWCKSFVDYSSSGLENPLTHFLLAVFFWVWRSENPSRSLSIYAIAGLIYLNRPDAVVLVIPAILACMLPDVWRSVVQGRVGREMSKILLGFSPVIAWTAFSVFYYGSPVPNTALAKVQNGLTWAASAQQAWDAIVWVARHDPVTLVVIGAGCLAGFKNALLRPLALGSVLWLVYFCYVGGDYMGGRFFSGPLVLSTLMLGAMRWPSKMALGWVVVLILFSSSLWSTVFSPFDYEAGEVASTGIADERGFYYQHLGIRPVIQNGGWWHHPLLRLGHALRLSGDGGKVYVKCNIGMTPYAAGPGSVFIDPLALTEPFLARMPARTGSRVGHYERAFPDGFLQARVSGKNTLEEPALQALWGDLYLATKADLLSKNRWAAIWRLNVNRELYKAVRFDRNAIGLPGIPVLDRSIFSCAGQTLWGTWQINP